MTKPKSPIQAFADKFKQAKLEMAQNDDDIIGCDCIVCVPVTEGEPLIFPDNIIEMCQGCGCRVQLRPNLPPGPKRLCYLCATKQAKAEGGEVVMMVSHTVIDDIKAYLKQRKE